MEKPYLLHMITPEKNISPFDANMAFDAGWDSIIPYTNVTMEEIQALVQDTIFSRSPSTVSKRTAIFIGGRDTHIAILFRFVTSIGLLSHMNKDFSGLFNSFFQIADFIW